MIKDIITGILLGGTMSVPGVSGGTMAIALGCYGRILGAATDLKHGFWYLFRILLICFVDRYYLHMHIFYL